ncbi:hypothetical protein LOAG_14617, partial [Loa loa]
IRTTVMVSCTIFVLPPFRKALFNLLGIKRHQNIAVIPLNNNYFSSRRNDQ